MLVSVLVGLAFVGGTVLLFLSSYAVARLFGGGTTDEETHQLAGSVLFRVSALHGLILALVFAQEMQDFQQLHAESALEANAIGDVYFDVDRYGPGGDPRIQKALLAYLETVVGDEWRGLGTTQRLTGAAWSHWDVAYSAVLDLQPSTDRQRELRRHMLERIHLVSETRTKRENHGSSSVGGMFWFAAIAGVVLVALGYGTFRPKRLNLAFLSLFASYTGLILFFIYAFGNPHRPPGVVQPDAHHRLLEQIHRAAGA